MIAFGHTHKPWLREIEGLHFVNTGSVGRPKDGDPRAGFAMVTMDGALVDVEHVRVDYDVRAAAAGIQQRSLPPDFAEYLRIGGILDEQS